MTRGEDALRRKAETAATAGRHYVSDIRVEHVREVLDELVELRRQRDTRVRIVLGVDPAAPGNVGPLVVGHIEPAMLPAKFFDGVGGISIDPPEVFHGVRMAGDGATLGERMAATGYASSWYDADERERLARGVKPHPFWLPSGYYSPSCMQMVERADGGDQCGLAAGDPLHDDPREGQDFDWPHGS